MKKSLERGDRLVGMLNFSGSSKIIELMALSGLDFGIIDTEHAVASWESCDHMVLTAKAAGLPVLIRVSDPREIDVLHALDTGADGIVVSHVSDAQTAERIVSHAYYAPRGIRGMCPAIRPAQYGKINWEKYAEHANEKMIVICLVEDRTGLENVESIAAVKGVDAVWCGSGDLSQSLGIPHSGTEHPQMAAAMARIRDACKGNGKAFMATAGSRPTAEYVDRLWEFGATVVSIAPDMMLIQNAFTDIVKTIKHGKR